MSWSFLHHSVSCGVMNLRCKVLRIGYTVHMVKQPKTWLWVPIITYWWNAEYKKIWPHHCYKYYMHLFLETWSQSTLLSIILRKDQRSNNIKFGCSMPNWIKKLFPFGFSRIVWLQSNSFLKISKEPSVSNLSGSFHIQSRNKESILLGKRSL